MLSPSRLRAPAIRLGGALALSALMLLGACSEFSSEEALIETTPSKGHPIAFVDRNEGLEVEMPPRGLGLSRSQWIDVYRFGIRYRQEGTGSIAIATPSGRTGAPRGSAAVADIRNALASAGIEPERITISGGAPPRTLALAFHRPVAVAPQCGHWYRDVGRERERVPHPDFGCATQRNLAGMVANARDLMGAQEETPASGERRGKVWSRYTGGDAAQSSAAGGSDSTSDAKPKAVKK